MLENDVEVKQGSYEGVYTFQGFSNGMDYWVDAEGENAIWYYVSGSNYLWCIAPLNYLSSTTFAIASLSNTLENKCPNNEGYVWDWMYSIGGGSFIATNDVYIKCSYENDFCTPENPCGIEQGDCDTHDECQNGLFCGSNNCPENLGFHSEFDCCYAVSVEDEDFCTTDNPCVVDEGDCDSDSECQGNLICDITISCPVYLGFASDVNCCSSGSECKCHQLILCLMIKKLYYFFSLVSDLLELWIFFVFI